MSGTAYDARAVRKRDRKGPALSSVETSALNKAAWRLVPLLTIAYLFNYLDRTCLGFAALTMNRDIGLSATQFGVGAGAFFAGYTLFEVPSNLALYKFGARVWIARIMITWGLVSAAMVLVTGPQSFYAVRFLLGVAEAGFFPGITFFLGSWFPRAYRARMLAWFLVGIPASSLIGGPLCGLLLQMNGIWGLAGWKWLFLAVSLPSVGLGVLVLKWLADSPERAAWLTREEAEALARLRAAETQDRPRTALLPALTDIRVLILALVQFGFTLGSYGIGIWLPLIMKDYKLSNLAIGLIAAIPYFFATMGMILWARHVDHTGKKIVNLTLACALAVAGLALYVFSGSLAVSLIALTLALVGVTAARAIFWTIPPRFLAGVAAAGGIAFINTIGTTGGFFGPAMMGVLKDATGGFETGILAMAAILALTTLLAFSLKLVVRQE